MTELKELNLGTQEERNEPFPRASQMLSINSMRELVMCETYDEWHERMKREVVTYGGNVEEHRKKLKEWIEKNPPPKVTE